MRYRTLGSLPSADDRHSRRSCVIVDAISNSWRFKWASFNGSECGPVSGSSNHIANDPVMLGDLCQNALMLPCILFRIHAALASLLSRHIPVPAPVVALVDPLRERYSHYGGTKDTIFAHYHARVR